MVLNTWCEVTRSSTRLPFIQQFANLTKGNRFGHEQVNATGESFSLITFGRETGKCNDQGRRKVPGPFRMAATVLFDFPDRACGFESVEDRH